MRSPLNVTVAEGENPTVGGGYVTVFPCGTRPDASNLNFIAGQTIPNIVIAPVSATGTICFYVYGTAHLLADVSGYFPAEHRRLQDRGSGRTPDSATGLLWCNRTADPTCAAGYFIGADAAGVCRRPRFEPVASYTITAHAGDTGWPCPPYIDSRGPHVPLRGSRGRHRRELSELDDLDHRQTGSLLVLIAPVGFLVEPQSTFASGFLCTCTCQIATQTRGGGPASVRSASGWGAWATRRRVR